MSGQGFSDVHDIGASIQQWMGIKAAGAYELNLDLINPDVDFPDAFALAYAMENSLQQFYLMLEQEETKGAFKALYGRLAGLEERHKQRLLSDYKSSMDHSTSPEQFLEDNKHIIEGGDIVKNTTALLASETKNLVDVLGLSMAIEAQSLDLYTRLAGRTNDEAVKKLFHDLADEEKQHLNFITNELDYYLKN